MSNYLIGFELKINPHIVKDNLIPEGPQPHDLSIDTEVYSEAEAIDVVKRYFAAWGEVSE